jgi:hypothetical protein
MPKPPVRMESRDSRIGVRLTETERDELERAALAAGEELSRYVRGCLSIGHKVRQAGGALKVTVG